MSYEGSGHHHAFVHAKRSLKTRERHGQWYGETVGHPLKVGLDVGIYGQLVTRDQILELAEASGVESVPPLRSDSTAAKNRYHQQLRVC
jgi:hypothetical protein